MKHARPPVIAERAEDLLRLAMLNYFQAHGFTAMHRKLHELEAEIGRENRIALAIQGWIG